MSKYTLNKGNYKGIIIYMEYDAEGISFKPQKSQKAKKYIKVTTITLYEPVMIENLFAQKFAQKFTRLSEIVINFLYANDDDTDEGDYLILLDEIERLKSVIELKYKRYLEVEEYKAYIHKLAFLDHELREKIALINYRNRLNYEVSQGRSM